MNTSMTLEQLTGKYARLRQELVDAYSASDWRSGRIDRIAEELADTERALAAYPPVDEQAEAAQFDSGA